MFKSPLGHLAVELWRLDLLMHRQILRSRAAYQLSLDEFRGLYVSDEQVDNLLNGSGDAWSSDPTVDALSREAEAILADRLEPALCSHPWKRLAEDSGLDRFEQDVLLLAVAPELDLKYETLLAYLNNDVTRKWPTRDLALRMFTSSRDERTQRRRQLQDGARLFRTGLLRPVEQPQACSWLATAFRSVPEATDYLLGGRPWDQRLDAFAKPIEVLAEDRLPLADQRRERFGRIARQYLLADRGTSPPLLIFEGQDERARLLATEQICRILKIPLIHVDLRAARSCSAGMNEWSAWLFAQQHLTGCAILLDACEALLTDGRRVLPEARCLARRLADVRTPVMFASDAPLPWLELFGGYRGLTVRCDPPDETDRRRLWQFYTAEAGCAVDETTSDAMADRYVLAHRQISDVVSMAADAHRLSGRQSEPIGPAAFSQAVSAQTSQELAGLAEKVPVPHTWDDLVLPPATIRQVKEVSAAMRNRHVVYRQWGFQGRLTSGQGVKVLFAGSPGTGKTMAAGVIAAELGVDLFLIDLSQVVSKYIGETERNLSSIFRACSDNNGNAIIFFDEAEALYGRRSEVKDAHDRYANIEVAYLLQKIEAHEGDVILASNLKKNIDEAFSRRLHYVIEFPMPNAPQREQIWRGMFPPQAPVADGVDFPFLATQFDLTGGDIKNIALDAAFLAAEDGRVIDMVLLVKALSRHLTKKGKIPCPGDFKQYHALVGQMT